MIDQTQTLSAVPPRTAAWVTPAGVPAVALQALVFIYIGVLTSLVDGLAWIGSALLPTRRLSAWVETLARAAARRMLADERDWPILPAIAAITFLVPASAALQFMNTGAPWWALGLLHHAVLLGAGGRRFAKLFSIKHNEAHRPRGFFRGWGARWMRRYVEGFSTLFYGNIFGLDVIHHVKVHHAEDGGPDDPQRTRGYDRTSTYDFLHYMGVRHLSLSVGWGTPRYLLKNGRTRDARAFLLSVAAYYTGVALLFWINWRAAIVIAVVPLLMSNLFAALASWLQHSFERVDASGDPIADTITIISPTDFLNEGFHLAHHYRSSTHWTELPQRFEEWRAKHPGSEPMLLEGVDWVDLAVLLYVRRRLDLVAACWKPSSPERATLSVDARMKLLADRLGGRA